MSIPKDKQKKADDLLLLSDVLLEEFKELHPWNKELDKLKRESKEAVAEEEIQKTISGESEKPEPPDEEKKPGGSPDASEKKEKKTLSENERLEVIFKAIHNLEEKRAALCLSGGGIRSATFCLGILQGLARQNLLDKFHYLSTVSGGGYIGSWLTAWIYREKGSAKKVFQTLKDNPHKLKTEPEPKAITHLRSYSNLLTPKTGLLSMDAWTLVFIYLRNLFLNWLVFIPLILAVLLVPRIYFSLVTKNFGIVLFLKRFGIDLSFLPKNAVIDWFSISALILGGISGAFALAYINSHRPSIRNITDKPSDDPAENNSNQKDTDTKRNFTKYFGIPLVAAVLLLTVGRAWRITPDADKFWAPWAFVVGGAGLMILAWLITFRLVSRDFGETVYKRFKRSPKKRFIELAIVLITGALGGLCLWILSIPGKLLKIIPGANPDSLQDYLWLDGPILMIVFLLMGMLSNGIGSSSIDDDDREWWARAGAWVLIITLGWTAINALVMWLPLHLLDYGFINVPLGSSGLIAGFVTIIFALSSKTPANDRLAEKAGWLTTLLSYGVKFAAPIFTAFLLILFSFITDFLIILIKYLSEIYNKPVREWRVPDEFFLNYSDVIEKVHNETSVLFLIVLCLVLLAISVVMASLININQFSLHSLYRNRLIRVYLGASNASRQPNAFTDFALDDNIRMSKLLKAKPGKRLRSGVKKLNEGIKKEASHNEDNEVIKPFHILNMTWNLVNGKKLAWQNRMATTFTVSSLHCGNYLNGYRHAAEYGGEGPKSISLGTAFTISGAAASPNMGYYSSTFVTFLMTLFNARLGWWLGNPRLEKYQMSGPNSALGPMIDEALGKTAEDKDYIYLSDGGHFENLGLYEMVLRRCHYIFVVDASRDPDYKFENLGNAIRRIRVDLGVNIEIVDYPRKQDKPSPYCAIGNIVYSNIDGKDADVGTLIYIKPNLIGDEPTDIFNYAQDNIKFPHEPTTDLWFSEQQFESYRELGSYAINRIFGKPFGNADFSDLRRRVEVYLGKAKPPLRKRQTKTPPAENGAVQIRAVKTENPQK